MAALEPDVEEPGAPNPMPPARSSTSRVVLPVHSLTKAASHPTVGSFSDVMDTNWLVELVHEVQGDLWVDRVNETHRIDRLCPWVSTFHPNNLPCQLEGTFHHGAFNAGMKMVFNDGTAWMVRFPRGGMVSDDHMDEKVSMEVTAMTLTRDNTTIPVPKVHAWGPAANNPLGLGPFIIMDFIDGVSLSDLLQDPNAERPSRVMRAGISNTDIEVIYRQMAGFLLQLFQLEFDRIGSLPSPQAKAQSPTPPRPLTFKAHSILQNGGLDVFGAPSILPFPPCSFNLRWMN